MSPAYTKLYIRIVVCWTVVLGKRSNGRKHSRAKPTRVNQCRTIRLRKTTPAIRTITTLADSASQFDILLELWRGWSIVWGMNLHYAQVPRLHCGPEMQYGSASLMNHDWGQFELLRHKLIYQLSNVSPKNTLHARTYQHV
jgi:hypothetical protein